MSQEIIEKIKKSLQSELKNLKERDTVNVGDTVVAHTKIIVKKKIQKKLTTAEKQAKKKAEAAGKSLDEMLNENLKSQPFKGVVIAIAGSTVNKKITVRKIGADNISVEKIIPLYSPVLDSLEILSKGKPRRAKLTYLRKRVGKKALKVKSA